MCAARIVCRLVLLACVAHNQIVETYDTAFASVCDELNLFFITRLKTYGGGGWDVQMHAECRLAVKFQIAIHLEEMEMRAHLNRSVARVFHFDGGAWSAGVVLYVIVGKYHRTYGYSLFGSEASLIGVKRLIATFFLYSK